MCVDGYWGTICDYGWDSRDADVVCRQLGFNTFGAVPRTNSHLGRGTGPVFLNRVSCYGIESTIFDCSFSMRSYSYCSGHLYDSGVECVGIVNSCLHGVHACMSYIFDCYIRTKYSSMYEWRYSSDRWIQ